MHWSFECGDDTIDDYPHTVAREVLREIHGGRLSSHLGDAKTLHKARENFTGLECQGVQVTIVSS